MADGEAEHDYLSMTFEDTSTAKETSLQRTARLREEAAERGRVPTKAERAERENAAREEALATELDASNKGAKLMAKMGFKGGALGKAEGARTQPIEINMKDGRGGIGMGSEKKRKIREAAEATQEGKRHRKVEIEHFRERNRAEQEEKRAEGQWWAAMKVLEGLEDGDPAKEDDHNGEHSNDNSNTTAKPAGGKPLRSIKLLYRPLVRDRMEKERERRRRHDLLQSLSRDREYAVDDADGKLAYGTEVEDQPNDEDEVDPELGEFQALPSRERLSKLVEYLRANHHYCFWCKYRYPDEALEGCPGLTEDEHG